MGIAGRSIACAMCLFLGGPAYAAALKPAIAGWLTFVAVALLPCAWLVLRIAIRNAHFGVPFYQRPQRIDADERWIIVECIVLSFVFRFALHHVQHPINFLR